VLLEKETLNMGKQHFHQYK